MEVRQGGFTPREPEYTWKTGFIVAGLYIASVMISLITTVAIIAIATFIVKPVWFW